MVEKKSVSFSDEIFKEIEKRTMKGAIPRSEVIENDLQNYYNLLSRSKFLILEKFSEPELLAFFTTQSSSAPIENYKFGTSLFTLKDAYTYGELNSIEGLQFEAFIEKIEQLTLAEELAMYDLSNIYWDTVEERYGYMLNENLKEVLRK